MSEKNYSESLSAEQLRRELERVKKRRFPFGKDKKSSYLKNGELPRINVTDRGIFLTDEKSSVKSEDTAPLQQTLSSPAERTVLDNEKTAEVNKEETVLELSSETNDIPDTAAKEAKVKDNEAFYDDSKISSIKDDKISSESLDKRTEDEALTKKTEETKKETQKDTEQKALSDTVSKEKLAPWEQEKLEKAEKEKAFDVLVSYSKKSMPVENVSANQIQEEIKRVRHKREYSRVLRETVMILLGVAAAAVLVSMLFLPVMRVTGTSMEPTLHGDDIVVCSRYSKIDKGDIIAFYFNNKVLLKRVIGVPGDIINISDSGKVMINGSEIDEPYTKDLSLGDCDLDFPVQVPENRIFVMGDNRETSIDSRSSAIGYIADEYVIGKVIFRAWPLGKLETF